MKWNIQKNYEQTSFYGPGPDCIGSPVDAEAVGWKGGGGLDIFKTFLEGVNIESQFLHSKKPLVTALQNCFQRQNQT